MISKYKSYDADHLQELFSNYLINSWSYSRVTSFARNEKAFEMQYIFGLFSRNSATTIAGQAYHHALQYFFTSKQGGKDIDLVELEQSAFQYIDEVPANRWKIQKTTPTVDDCKEKALKTVSALLRNFIGELSTYMSDIKEVIDVEVNCEEFLIVNGAEIPLPCVSRIDLVVKTYSDKIVIIDHKSKSSFTSEQEMNLSIGTQAITYVLAYEEKTGIDIDEVWFVENKYSQNKDKSAQLNLFRVELDINTRRLYEALLYEPLKRMLSAVNDPDYLYLINESDNFVDLAELYDFWARTMISEVEDFNVEASKKEIVSQRLRKIRDSSVEMINPQVIRKFKENAASFIQYDLSDKNMTQAEKIEHVLRSFGTMVKVAHIFDGYSSNTYLLEVSAGVKISSIYSHRLDIANALDVANVRISGEMVVHEGKSYLAIEFSKKRDRDLIYDVKELRGRKIPLGKDNFGNVIYWDFDNHSTPHILACGATGSGKSALINVVINYALETDIDEVVILDPKYEFRKFHDQNRSFVYNDIAEIEEQMANLVTEMESLVRTGRKKRTLIVFDEFADALAQSRKGAELDIKEMVQVGNYAPKKGPFGLIMEGDPKMKLQTVGQHKSLEENLRILAQKGRSLGYRIMGATQRASVKIITGDTKVNFPVQICFRVPKAADSMVVIDEAGAESLAGYGDGLIKSPEFSQTVRFQAFYKPE